MILPACCAAAAATFRWCCMGFPACMTVHYITAGYRRCCFAIEVLAMQGSFTFTRSLVRGTFTGHAYPAAICHSCRDRWRCRFGGPLWAAPCCHRYGAVLLMLSFFRERGAVAGSAA